MGRIIDPAALAELSAKNLRYMYMVDFQFDSGSIAFNTSLDQYTFDSKVFIGAGNLGQIGDVEETSNLDPANCTVTLSGVNQVILAALLAENYVNRRGIVYIALLDTSNAIVGAPFIYFDGLVSSLSITYGKIAQINITLKDRLSLWARPKIRRYTNQEQIKDFPTDKGFEFVESIADKEVIWPTAEFLRKNA